MTESQVFLLALVAAVVAGATLAAAAALFSITEGFSPRYSYYEEREKTQPHKQLYLVFIHAGSPPLK